MPLPKFDDFKFPDEQEEKEIETSNKIEVEIEDDTPEEDRGRKAAPPPEDPTDEELASYDERVQARLKKFTRGYHDERRAKEAAERERQAAEEFARSVYEENKKLKEQLNSGSKVFIEQNKSSAQMELETAKAAFKKAYEDGDADGIVAAQEAVSKATIKLERAQNLKPIQHEDQEFQKARPAPQQQAPKVSPRTQKWMEANGDWWGVDDEMTMAALGIDKRLQKEYGSDYVGSEEYFQTIDKTMRKRFPDRFDQSYEEDDQPRQKRSEPDEEDSRRAIRTSVVAPAERSSPPTRVKLKGSQVSLARRLGITPQAYAEQVAKLKRGE